MGILELNDRIKSINKYLLKIEAIEDNQDELRELQISQHLDGLSADGSFIRPKYTEKYLKRKRKLGYTGDGTPNLRLSGLFHNETDFVIQDEQYELTSFVEYSRFLAARYKGLFGFNDTSMKQAKEICTRSYIKLWKEKAGL